MVKQQNGDGGRKLPAHPYYSWTKSLEAADAVNRAGGNRAPVDKQTIAHELGMEANSPSLSQLLSSAKCFGMIEGHGSVKLTEPGINYFLPTSPADSREAELSFLVSPKCFELLISRFDGNALPPPKTIANILMKDGHVPPSWAERVAGIFMEALTRLRLVDGGGRLRYAVAKMNAIRSEVGKLSDDAKADAKLLTVGPVPLPAKNVLDPATNTVNAWHFTEVGATVRVETPNPLPRALWERLKRYVEILEPPAPGGPMVLKNKRGGK